MTRIRGDLIAAGRKALRENQTEFARKCGVNRSALAAVENGNDPSRTLSLTAVLRVAERLGRPVDDLCYGFRPGDDASPADGDDPAGDLAEADTDASESSEDARGPSAA